MAEKVVPTDHNSTEKPFLSHAFSYETSLIFSNCIVTELTFSFRNQVEELVSVFPVGHRNHVFVTNILCCHSLLQALLHIAHITKHELSNKYV